MSYICDLYLITDDIIDTEDTEETEFIDDVLLGRGDHLLVVGDEETQPTAGHHRAQEQQAEQNLSHLLVRALHSHWSRNVEALL